MALWFFLALVISFFTGIVAAFFLAWKILLFVMVIWILLGGMVFAVAHLEDSDFLGTSAATILLVGIPFFIMGWVTELLRYLLSM